MFSRRKSFPFEMSVYVLNAPSSFIRLWAVLRRALPKAAEKTKFISYNELVTIVPKPLLPAPWGNQPR